MLSLKNDAQKGETYVYLGVGINRLWLVFLLLIFIILAVTSGIIEGVKKGLKK